MGTHCPATSPTETLPQTLFIDRAPPNRFAGVVWRNDVVIFRRHKQAVGVSWSLPAVLRCPKVADSGIDNLSTWTKILGA